MPNYKTPGVYVEEISLLPSIQSFSDVAVFIGYTEKSVAKNNENLTNIPTKVFSLTEFEEIFGFPQSESFIITDNSTENEEDILLDFSRKKSLHNLYYSIKLFFLNGGSSCKIVSVGDYKKLGNPLSASEILLGLESLRNDESNLIIAVPECQNLDEDELYMLQEKMLEFCESKRSFAVLDVPKISDSEFMVDIKKYREKLTSNSLKFGASYFPNLIANFAYFYENSEVQISRNALETLLSDFEKTDPKLFKKYTDLLENNFVKIPPSAAVIAKYLKTDEERGIWKAPATIALEEVKSLEFYIKNDNEQKLLNFDEIFGKSINCIRKFSGR